MARLDAQFGIKLTYAARYIAGLACLVGMQLFVAAVTQRVVLLLLCALAGLSDYYASGTLTQVAGLYGGTPSVVFIGQSSCGIVLLLYTLATGFGDDADKHDTTQPNGGSSAVGGAGLYFALCAGVSFVAAAVFCRFWWWDPCARSVVANAEAGRQQLEAVSLARLQLLRSEMQAAQQGAGAADGRLTGRLVLIRDRYKTELGRLAEYQQARAESNAQEWLLLRRAAAGSWQLQLAIMLNWVALLGVQSYFTRIRCTDGAAVEEAPPAAAVGWAAAVGGSMNQQLVYVNMFALAVGQWLPDWLPNVAAVSQTRLLGASAAILVVSLPTVAVYVAGGIGVVTRLRMCLAMGVFFGAGSSLWMLTYRFVATMEPPLQPPTIRMLNLSLEIGILLGIATSALLHGS
jgi:hypothetical protein